MEIFEDAIHTKNVVFCEMFDFIMVSNLSTIYIGCAHGIKR